MYSPGVNPAAGVLFALLLMAAIGWLVNKLSGKPKMNWPAWLAGWYLIAFALSLFLIFSRPVDKAYELGRHVAMYLIPAALAAAYARRWRRMRPL